MRISYRQLLTCLLLSRQDDAKERIVNPVSEEFGARRVQNKSMAVCGSKKAAN